MTSTIRRCMFLSVLIGSAFCLGVLAKDPKPAKSTENEDVALIIGDASERYPVVGTGGIRVSGGHHGIFQSNMKTSTVWIDGSGVSAQRFLASHENADFMAVANCAHFVTQSALCTLPSAAGIAGEEIIICNAGGSAITYRTTNGEVLVNGNQSDSPANSTAGKVDRFISDGKAWYKE